MDTKKLNYALLAPATTLKEVNALAEKAVAEKADVVVIAPAFVKKVKAANPSFKIAAAVAYPAGFSTIATKVYEIKNAIKCGADEVVAVLNQGDIKARKFTNVGKEIKKMMDALKGAPLTVAFDASLVDEKKIAALATTISAEKPAYVLALNADEKAMAALTENLSAAVKIRSL